MKDKLIQLGLRLEGDFTLTSGVQSKVKWDIERLFNYPLWIIHEAIREFTWQVGVVRPYWIIGIPTGGKLLAKCVAQRLGYARAEICGIPSWLNDNFQGEGTMLIDDVFTTGGTVKSAISQLRNRPLYIATLINRSGVEELDGIPIISGLEVDLV